jgi:hypothetical protein
MTAQPLPSPVLASLAWALRLRRRWLGSQRRSAARSARCSSRLAAQERSARLVGILFSVPSFVSSDNHRVLERAPSLSSAPPRPTSWRRRTSSAVVATLGRPTKREDSASCFWLGCRCGLGFAPPSCRCVGGHRRRSCPVVTIRPVHPPGKPKHPSHPNHPTFEPAATPGRPRSLTVAAEGITGAAGRFAPCSFGAERALTSQGGLGPPGRQPAGTRPSAEAA